MSSKIYEAFRTRRLALALSQAEVARRSGVQQRQVSSFERGGDVTLSTFFKLAQSLETEPMLVPREDIAKIESLLNVKREPVIQAPPLSLLERYQVKDDEEPSNG